MVTVIVTIVLINQQLLVWLPSLLLLAAAGEILPPALPQAPGMVLCSQLWFLYALGVALYLLVDSFTCHTFGS